MAEKSTTAEALREKARVGTRGFAKGQRFPEEASAQIPVCRESLAPVVHAGPVLSSFALPRTSRRRLAAPWLALCLSALTLCGCERQKLEHEAGVLTVVPTQSATWIRHFNPFLVSQARWGTLGAIYEPLLIYNSAQGNYVPWLAESYGWSSDNLTLTFQLRRGVLWSDGRPLTARDVVFTFELMKRYKALDQNAIWKKLASIEAEGDQTVRVHFKEPFVPALFFIGESPIVAEHTWKNVKDPITFRDENPVGTGPFTQVRMFKTQVYELGRNPHYWQPGKPKIDAVRVPAFPGNEQASLALLRGELDWAALFIPAIDRIFVDKDRAHHGYQFAKVEGTVMLYPNHLRAPYGDVRVRKAISQAIDRKLIVRIAMQGYTDPAPPTGLTDLYARYKDQALIDEIGDFNRHDAARAESLLDEAGLRRGPGGLRTLPDGSPWKVDITCVAGWSDWIIAGQIIAKNLRAIGVDATLRTYDFGAYFQRLQTGDYDLGISWSTTGGPSLYTYYHRQMSTETVKPLGQAAEYNWQRFGSTDADALLAALAKTSDPEEEGKLARKLERIFLQNAPALPLFPGPAWGEYVSTRFTGFPTQANPFAALAPYKAPGYLLTLVELEPTPANEEAR
jgi:peptide/nickel transport system substrate-binding protein